MTSNRPVGRHQPKKACGGANQRPQQRLRSGMSVGGALSIMLGDAPGSGAIESCKLRFRVAQDRMHKQLYRYWLYRLIVLI